VAHLWAIAHKSSRRAIRGAARLSRQVPVSSRQRPLEPSALSAGRFPRESVRSALSASTRCFGILRFWDRVSALRNPRRIKRQGTKGLLPFLERGNRRAALPGRAARTTRKPRYVRNIFRTLSRLPSTTSHEPPSPRSRAIGGARGVRGVCLPIPPSVPPEAL
jgi:hypothetical protein